MGYCILKKCIIIASLFVISSCATPEKWIANTSEPSPLGSARNMCMQRAIERYPVSYSINSANTSFSPMMVNGKEIPNTAAGSTFSSDRNEWERKDYFNTCMRAEGWENKNKVTGLLAFLFN